MEQDQEREELTRCLQGFDPKFGALDYFSRDNRMLSATCVQLSGFRSK
jgi:hypothetical protein